MLLLHLMSKELHGSFPTTNMLLPVTYITTPKTHSLYSTSLKNTLQMLIIMTQTWISIGHLYISSPGTGMAKLINPVDES